MKFKKLLSLPIMLGLLLVAGVIAAPFVVSLLGLDFGVKESLSVQYAITDQSTVCSSGALDSAWNNIPVAGVTLPDTLPGDNNRVCFKVISSNDDPVDVTLVKSAEWDTSSLIASSTVTNPGKVDHSATGYGNVDYSISGSADPSKKFTGTISVGRE